MRRILIFSVLIFTTLGVFAQVTDLASGWKAKRASELTDDGYTLTEADPDFSDWMNATVPGTILTTLLNNNKIPDPFYEMNIEQIPDIYTAGRDYYTYWFFNRFTTEGVDSLKQIWLSFRGINYMAEIYLNGRRINPVKHEGMFIGEKFNITAYVNRVGYNRLAVLVEPPLHPGNPNGGQGGDGTIGRDATMQFTAGWDWIQPVRDRNTGIWDKVTIEITDAVDIRNMYARTRVPGVRLPGELQDPAYVTFSAELVNTSDKVIEGDAILTYLIKTEKKKVRLEPGSTTEVVFSEIKQNDPKVWWPNGMGQQSLYMAGLTFSTKDGKVSDREDIMFGYREVSGYFDDQTGSRVFTINGQKIFIRGANWIASDAMLRLTPERYDAEVKMHAEMNMNMIRVWGGSIYERPEFYKACDKYGLLVWQDLPITGDCNGRWPDRNKLDTQEQRRQYPDNKSLFINSLADQIKLLRNHPSLYMWCGGNEFPPPSELDTLIRGTIEKLDGTRYYLDESTSPELLRNTIGGNGDGPYAIKDPLWFFNQKWYPFNPEIGSAGMPNMESLKKIMSPKNIVPPVMTDLNEVWKYHKYQGYGDAIEQYGQVTDIEDFINKAQLAGYEQYRSLQEGFNSHMWSWYTGALIWKSQNPWTALKGQFYDWFLDQNAGFYAYKHAAAPVHMQLNLNDSAIFIINATPKERKGIKAEAILTDETGKELWKKSKEIVTAPNSITKLWDKDFPVTDAKVYFLKMKLTYLTTSVLVDDNIYWLPVKGDKKALMELGETTMAGQMIKSNNGKLTVEMTNTGEIAAFFVRMKVIKALSGEMASPVFMDDNYFVMLPGEKKTMIIDISSLPPEDKNTPLLLVLKGINLQPYSIRL